MPLPDKQFLYDISRGEILSPDKYWSQLDDILATDSRHPFAVRDTTQLWKRAAHWMYCNPDTPWAPETEELFHIGFTETVSDSNMREQNRLLQAWMRFGTHTPSADHQRMIVEEMARAPFQGFQWMQYAFNAADWVSPEQQAERLRQAQADANGRPTPTAYSMYVYLHGDISGLSPAQKQDANRHLCGEVEDYPIGFAQAAMVAKVHPEPEVWTACMMDQAWSITKNPGPDDLWTNASSAIEHLDALLDTMPWDQSTPENTRCLVTAALMEREGNLLGLDMSAWERRNPAAWAQTKSMLPVLECLHNIPAGPYDSGLAVNRLVPLVLDELQRLHVAQSIESPVDPSLFSMPEVQ